MGIVKSNKSIDKTSIDCGDSFNIKISFSAVPDIVSSPTDIVLILDRSGSMAGSPLANMKSGAKKFIDIIDEATDNAKDGQIGSGSRIGIVSFSTTAVQNTQLITDVDDLKAKVDALVSGGSTNHADAFEKAIQLFDPASSNAKVMVMFTDGVTTAGAPPSPVAEAAKAQGIIIYVIGLSGNGGIDEQALSEWASDPDSAYLAITPDDAALEDLFEDLAKNITKPGATGIVVNEKISPCFQIISLSSPTKGTASLINSTTVKWNIDELGVTQSEGAVLEFEVRHIGSCTGTLFVNEDISYSDNEGNNVTFPSPQIYVDCGVIVHPEECPTPIDLQVSGCNDVIEFDAGDIEMQSLGRIVRLNVTLKNICPNRRVALAAMLTEVDSNGIEYKRGMKMMTIPAHGSRMCRNVTVHGINFVLPEDISVSSDESGSICHERNLKARFIMNYIDSGFDCDIQ